MTPAVADAIYEAIGVSVSPVASDGDDARELWFIRQSGQPNSILYSSKKHQAILLDTRSDTRSVVRHLMTYPEAFIEDPYSFPYINTIEYYVTSACNLGCSYCYLGSLPSRTSPSDRDPSAAIATLEALFEADRVGPELTLLLIGGEPLLGRSAIFPIVDWLSKTCTERNVRLAINLTTNGTLLNETVANWLEANSISVTLSYDGAYQNTNRPKKTKMHTEVDVDYLLRRLGPERLSVRATLMPDQHEFQAATFSELQARGFTKVAISGAYGRPSSHTDLVSMAKGIAQLEAVCASTQFWEAGLSAAHEALITGKLARSHCAAGTGHLVLDSSGETRACANYDLAQMAGTLRYDVDEDGVCGTCALRYVCNATGGGCRAWRGLNGSNKPDELECTASATRILLALSRLSRGLVREE